MGALTLKPLAFKTRSWELSYTEYPNFFDNNFGLINIQKRGAEIMRILPSRHDSYYWITNKTRFFFETLKIKRLMFPFLKLNSDIVKIKWSKFIKFLQYFRIIQNLSHRFLRFSQFYYFYEIDIDHDLNYKYGNISYFNNTYSALDFLSNFLAKKLFSFNNTSISYENKKPFIGNTVHNYINTLDLKKNKINIFLNFNIVYEFPRIWSTIKKDNINYFIGLKKNLNLALTHISNRFNKQIILNLFKDRILLYTENKVDINFSQIILKQNIELSEYTNLWFDNKKDFGILNKENFYLSFNANNNNQSKTGIHFNFQNFGHMSNAKYSFFLPISSVLEDRKLLLDGYGNLQDLKTLISRKLNVRTLSQFCLILHLVLTIYKKRHYRFTKQIRLSHLKNPKVVEYIILLMFGRLDLTFKHNDDLTNFLHQKLSNSITITQYHKDFYDISSKNNY